MAKKELTYKTAMEELETLAAQLENEEVDVDKLSEMIHRASELLLFCKSRLIKTQEEVENAMKNFEEQNNIKD